MLGALLDYARSHNLLAEPGFAPKVVRWALVCDGSGRFLEGLDLAGEDSKAGRSFPKCPELSHPELKRGGAGCRHFLVDSADVVALLADGEPDPKLLAKHAYFTGLMRRASGVLPVLAGIADILDDPDQLASIQAALRAGKAKPTERVTFAVLGGDPAYPVESDAWHDWWRGFRKTLGEEKSSRKPRGDGEVPLALCLATGDLVEPVATHPKIAGLTDVGGLAMGDALASFKQEAFCSYGFVQSANAAVSEQGAAEYRAALNHLIRENGKRLAGAKVVPWFKKRVAREEDPFAFLADESIEEGLAMKWARDLLEALKTGKKPDLLDNHYYALTLSGASGRVMVRDWMEGQFPELVQNVNAWFEDFSIVRRDGNGLAPEPKIRPLLGAIVRDLKDVPPSLEARMWRAAVHGEPIPREALARALSRVRVDILKDQPFHHGRLGLLKAFHLRKELKGDRSMRPRLKEDHPEAAYQCGRLMALLAAVQYRALGDVGAGVVQRYYAAASATPALVLGRLVRTAQFHLGKLDRGLALWHEARIADVMSRIGEAIPRMLDLEEQSLFALGYYQQIASDRSKTRPEGAAGETPDTPEETANV